MNYLVTPKHKNPFLKGHEIYNFGGSLDINTIPSICMMIYYSFSLYNLYDYDVIITMHLVYALSFSESSPKE